MSAAESLDMLDEESGPTVSCWLDTACLSSGHSEHRVYIDIPSINRSSHCVREACQVNREEAMASDFDVSSDLLSMFTPAGSSSNGNSRVITESGRPMSDSISAVAYISMAGALTDSSRYISSPSFQLRQTTSSTNVSTSEDSEWPSVSRAGSGGLWKTTVFIDLGGPEGTHEGTNDYDSRTEGSGSSLQTSEDPRYNLNRRHSLGTMERSGTDFSAKTDDSVIRDVTHNITIQLLKRSQSLTDIDSGSIGSNGGALADKMFREGRSRVINILSDNTRIIGDSATFNHVDSTNSSDDRYIELEIDVISAVASSTQSGSDTQSITSTDNKGRCFSDTILELQGLYNFDHKQSETKDVATVHLDSLLDNLGKAGASNRALLRHYDPTEYTATDKMEYSSQSLWHNTEHITPSLDLEKDDILMLGEILLTDRTTYMRTLKVDQTLMLSGTLETLFDGPPETQNTNGIADSATRSCILFNKLGESYGTDYTQFLTFLSGISHEEMNARALQIESWKQLNKMQTLVTEYICSCTSTVIGSICWVELQSDYLPVLENGSECELDGRVEHNQFDSTSDVEDQLDDVDSAILLPIDMQLHEISRRECEMKEQIHYIFGELESTQGLNTYLTESYHQNLDVDVRLNYSYSSQLLHFLKKYPDIDLDEICVVWSVPSQFHNSSDADEDIEDRSMLYPENCRIIEYQQETDVRKATTIHETIIRLPLFMKEFGSLATETDFMLASDHLLVITRNQTIVSLVRVERNDSTSIINDSEYVDNIDHTGDTMITEDDKLTSIENHTFYMGHIEITEAACQLLAVTIFLTPEIMFAVEIETCKTSSRRSSDGFSSEIAGTSSIQDNASLTEESFDSSERFEMNVLNGYIPVNHRFDAATEQSDISKKATNDNISSDYNSMLLGFLNQLNLVSPGDTGSAKVFHYTPNDTIIILIERSCMAVPTVAMHEGIVNLNEELSFNNYSSVTDSNTQELKISGTDVGDANEIQRRTLKRNFPFERHDSELFLNYLETVPPKEQYDIGNKPTTACSTDCACHSYQVVDDYKLCYSQICTVKYPTSNIIIASLTKRDSIREHPKEPVTVCKYTADPDIFLQFLTNEFSCQRTSEASNSKWLHEPLCCRREYTAFQYNAPLAVDASEHTALKNFSSEKVCEDVESNFGTSGSTCAAPTQNDDLLLSYIFGLESKSPQLAESATSTMFQNMAVGVTSSTIIAILAIQKQEIETLEIHTFQCATIFETDCQHTEVISPAGIKFQRDIAVSHLQKWIEITIAEVIAHEKAIYELIYIFCCISELCEDELVFDSVTEQRLLSIGDPFLVFVSELSLQQLHRDSILSSYCKTNNKNVEVGDLEWQSTREVLTAEYVIVLSAIPSRLRIASLSAEFYDSHDGVPKLEPVDHDDIFLAFLSRIPATSQSISSELKKPGDYDTSKPAVTMLDIHLQECFPMTRALTMASLNERYEAQQGCPFEPYSECELVGSNIVQSSHDLFISDFQLRECYNRILIFDECKIHTAVAVHKTGTVANLSSTDTNICKWQNYCITDHVICSLALTDTIVFEPSSCIKDLVSSSDGESGYCKTATMGSSTDDIIISPLLVHSNQERTVFPSVCSMELMVISFVAVQHGSRRNNESPCSESEPFMAFIADLSGTLSGTLNETEDIILYALLDHYLRDKTTFPLTCINNINIISFTDIQVKSVMDNVALVKQNDPFVAFLAELSMTSFPIFNITEDINMYGMVHHLLGDQVLRPSPIITHYSLISFDIDVESRVNDLSFTMPNDPFISSFCEVSESQVLFNGVKELILYALIDYRQRDRIVFSSTTVTVISFVSIAIIQAESQLDGSSFMLLIDPFIAFIAEISAEDITKDEVVVMCSVSDERVRAQILLPSLIFMSAVDHVIHFASGNIEDQAQLTDTVRQNDIFIAFIAELSHAPVAAKQGAKETRLIPLYGYYLNDRNMIQSIISCTVILTDCNLPESGSQSCSTNDPLIMFVKELSRIKSPDEITLIPLYEHHINDRTMVQSIVSCFVMLTDLNLSESSYSLCATNDPFIMFVREISRPMFVVHEVDDIVVCGMPASTDLKPILAELWLADHIATSKALSTTLFAIASCLDTDAREQSLTPDAESLRKNISMTPNSDMLLHYLASTQQKHDVYSLSREVWILTTHDNAMQIPIFSSSTSTEEDQKQHDYVLLEAWHHEHTITTFIYLDNAHFYALWPMSDETLAYATTEPSHEGEPQIQHDYTSSEIILHDHHTDICSPATDPVHETSDSCDDEANELRIQCDYEDMKNADLPGIQESVPKLRLSSDTSSNNSASSTDCDFWENATDSQVSYRLALNIHPNVLEISMPQPDSESTEAYFVASWRLPLETILYQKPQRTGIISIPLTNMQSVTNGTDSTEDSTAEESDLIPCVDEAVASEEDIGFIPNIIKCTDTHYASFYVIEILNTEKRFQVTNVFECSLASSTTMPSDEANDSVNQHAKSTNYICLNLNRSWPIDVYGLYIRDLDLETWAFCDQHLETMRTHCEIDLENVLLGLFLNDFIGGRGGLVVDHHNSYNNIDGTLACIGSVNVSETLHTQTSVSIDSVVECFVSEYPSDDLLPENVHGDNCTVHLSITINITIERLALTARSVDKFIIALLNLAFGDLDRTSGIDSGTCEHQVKNSDTNNCPMYPVYCIELADVFAPRSVMHAVYRFEYLGLESDGIQVANDTGSDVTMEHTTNPGTNNNDVQYQNKIMSPTCERSRTLDETNENQWSEIRAYLSAAENLEQLLDHHKAIAYQIQQAQKTPSQDSCVHIPNENTYSCSLDAYMKQHIIHLKELAADLDYEIGSAQKTADALFITLSKDAQTKLLSGVGKSVHCPTTLFLSPQTFGESLNQTEDRAEESQVAWPTEDVLLPHTTGFANRTLQYDAPSTAISADFHADGHERDVDLHPKYLASRLPKFSVAYQRSPVFSGAQNTRARPNIINLPPLRNVRNDWKWCQADNGFSNATYRPYRSEKLRRKKYEHNIGHQAPWTNQDYIVPSRLARASSASTWQTSSSAKTCWDIALRATFGSRTATDLCSEDPRPPRDDWKRYATENVRLKREAERQDWYQTMELSIKHDVQFGVMPFRS